MSVEEPASEPAAPGPPARGEGHRSGHLPPRVTLGPLAEGGLAPAVAAIVERGVRRRPHMANRLAFEFEIKVIGPYPPTRVAFGPGEVLVEDGPALAPLLRVEGALADLVALLSTPVGFAGLPNPATPRGRAALALVARGRVRFEGPIGPRRELLRLLRV